MGVELQYQGLPPECGLIELMLELAAHDPEEAARVQFLPSYLREYLVATPARAAFNAGPVWDWCGAALARYPDLADRNLDLDRDFDKLFYLLSAWRRARRNWRRADPAGFEAFDLLIVKAFVPEEPIDSRIRACQGIPLWRIAPDVVRDIGTCVACLEFDELAAHFDPRRMHHCGVYKMHASEEPWYREQSLQDLRVAFESFSAFFCEAARRDEMLLACID